MVWKVAIFGKKRHKIVVDYNVITEMVKFTGFHKTPTKEWVIYAEEVYTLKEAFERIDEIIFEVYQLMKQRIEKYETLCELMSKFKNTTVEIPGEIPDENDEVDQEVK